MNTKSLIAIFSLVGLLPLGFAAEAASSRFQHFITRQGNKLYDGDREFRFVGANMPGLVLPYDYTLSLPERMRLPTPWEQEDAFKTLDQMNGGSCGFVMGGGPTCRRKRGYGFGSS